MKHLQKWIAATMTGLLLIGAQPVLAEAQWSEDYYRITDPYSLLTEKEIDNIDQNCIEVVSQFHVDIAGAIVTPADYADSSMEALGDAFYQNGNYGYGENRDGYMVVYDMEKHEMCINGYGIAATLLDETALNAVIIYSCDQLETYGYWGVMASPPLFIKKLLTEKVEDGSYVIQSTDTPPVDPPTTETSTPETVDAETSTPETAVSETAPETAASAQTAQNGLPAWYPAPGTPFVPFHNDINDPRVVDEADIFTPEEEGIILQMIQDLQNEHQKDFVVYTSNTAYGMEHEALASAFYDYCGYGLGEEYEGMCLLFVMEPGNRGFAIWAYGPITRELYTRSTATYMDDCLYEFVKPKGYDGDKEIPGDYGLGVMNYIENLNTLYTYGYPAVPSWYTGEETEVFHDSSAPRVTAERNLLTESEIQILSERCSAIAQKTGIDVAIHVTNDSYWMPDAEYAERFFRNQGYGYGDSHDGILLMIERDEAKGICTAYVYTSGKPLASLTEVNMERLTDHARDKAVFSGVYNASVKWLNDMDHMVKTGRVMPSIGYWIFMAVLSLIGGFILLIVWELIFGGKSKKPKLNESAAHYVVKDSLVVRAIRDTLLRTRTEKTYSPQTTDSGKGSSSGGSRYNSSYTSSSGRTGTTSGRSF